MRPRASSAKLQDREFSQATARALISLVRPPMTAAGVHNLLDDRNRNAAPFKVEEILLRASEMASRRDRLRRSGSPDRTDLH